MRSLIEIREANEGDLETIGGICVAAYEAADQLDDGPHQGYGAVLADTRSRIRDAHLLVATRDDEIVGTVTICPPGSPFREIGQDGEVEFRFLAVAPSAWGSGVGGALIDACEQHARSEQASRIVICVRDINTTAMELYVRHGFTRIPERDWWPVPEVRLLGLCKEL